MSKKKEESKEAVEVLLGSQLGSDYSNYLANGLIDVRRLSKIKDKQIADMNILLTVPKYRGGDFLRKIIYNDLNLSMSEDGWRANLIVKFIAGTTGTQNTSEERDLRSWTERHLTLRDKDKAKDQGKIVEE